VGRIGGYSGFPPADGWGAITAPTFAFRNLAGAFDVENKGVAPDVESWNDPAAVRQGRDPQLEKAVEVALEQLRRNPPSQPAEPVYPVYTK
jgi:tricorn protease